MYKKAPINSYKEKINQAAFDLCVQSPDLLTDRKMLLANARKSVHNMGYEYKKGKSCSREFSIPSEIPVAKRSKLDSCVRTEQINCLQGRLNAIDESVQYKASLCEVNERAKNYKMCNELTDEIYALKCEKNVVNCELSILKKKDSKSKWYYRRKSSSTSESDTSGSSSSSSCSSSSADGHMPLAESSVINQPNPFCLGLPPV